MRSTRDKPRVGVLTYGLDRTPAGIGRYAVELLRAMAALPDGPEIVLLTTEREDCHGLWGTFERHALPGCRLLPALITIGHAIVSLAANRYHLDLIHDPNGIAPFLAPSAGVRRIVTVHDAFAYVCPEEHNRLDNWRYRALLPRAARGAEMVLTDSNSSRKDLARYLGLVDRKVRAVAGGVDARFRPVADGSERRAVLSRYGIAMPYLLYVGGINARKNIARLLEAYAALRKRHPQVTLAIAGKWQWRTDEINATFRRLNLERHVRFTGYVCDDDLPALYSAAELFVLPSLYEGFGLTVLEAMACGTPVVTSNTSSLPEVAGEAALLFEPHDAETIAEAIHRVLDDHELATELKRRGLARARQFTWERTAHETVDVYERVLGGSSAT